MNKVLSPAWLNAAFQDNNLDEILINGCHSLQTIGGPSRCMESPFTSDEEMRISLQTLAFSQNMRLDPLQPAAGGLISLKEGEDQQLHIRWHALLPPVARDGPLLSLRRHRLDLLKFRDFVGSEAGETILQLLRLPRPLLISGPTGSGKTSLLIALLKELAADERVAILEQLPEIPRLSPFWIRLCAQSRDLSGRGAFDLNAIFDELLRLRPDRLVIGELRSQEARTFKRSLLAGHGAAWCTLHAGSPELVSERLAEMSGDRLEFWEKILIEQSALLLSLQREKPRLSEAWLRREKSWELIFSAKGK